MISYKEIVNKLKKELNINEVQLAKRLGISQQTLSERKKKNAKTFDDIIQLCLKEQIDLNSLFQELTMIKPGIYMCDTVDKNGCTVLNNAYFSWKIPQDILQIVQRDKEIIKAYTIRNNSLSPFLNKDDAVIFRSLEALESFYHKLYELQDGDLILYQYNDLSLNQKKLYIRKIYMTGKNQCILKALDKTIPDYIVDFSPNTSIEYNEINIIGVVKNIIQNNISSI